MYFCSYLALVGGLACEADFIFIPEMPPKVDWPDRLCSQLAQARCSSINHFFCTEKIAIVSGI